MRVHRKRSGPVKELDSESDAEWSIRTGDGNVFAELTRVQSSRTMSMR